MVTAVSLGLECGERRADDLKTHEATNTKEQEVTKEAAAVHLTSLSRGTAVTVRHPQAASSVLSDRSQIVQRSCWDSSYLELSHRGWAGQETGSSQPCLVYTALPAQCTFPQWIQTNSMANLMEAEQKQLLPPPCHLDRPSSGLTPCTSR